MIPYGTIVNTIAVVLGSSIGLFLHNRFPDKIKNIVFQGIGLCTLVIGIQMALEVENLLILIFSILIGGIIGEIINLEKHFELLSEKLKKSVKSSNSKFSEGLITAFLIFCIGSMTIVGSINEGISGDRTLLYTKSILDGFTSIALAASYGIGVLFSFIPLFLLQGGLTLLASRVEGFFELSLINQLTAVGGVLILGIGINILGTKKIQVTNLLPALVVVVILSKLFL